MKLCLVDMSGTMQFELTQGKNFVGRDPSCEVHIDDKLLSRKHAVIGVAIDQVAIRDLQSTNGTMVNFKRVDDARHLQVGDSVTFGELTFRLAQVGVPLQQTVLGQSSNHGQSFSVSDPGDDGTALRESFPLPKGFHHPSRDQHRSSTMDVEAILRQSGIDLSGAQGALVGGFGKQEGAVFKLSHGVQKWELGRGDTCHILLAHETISQRHAQIWRESGAWFIEDLNSKNGTKINGKKLQKSVLSGGDQIEVGFLQYIFIDLVKSPAMA